MMQLDKEKIDRIKIWSKGGKPSPLILEISPTSNCNLICKFCRQPKESLNVQELPFDQIKKILSAARELGVKYVIITGNGEPFVYKEILPLLKLIKKYNMWGLTITNGTLITPESAEKIIKIGWDRLQFSIDSFRPELHDELRNQKGCFSRVKKSLDLINKCKEEACSEKPILAINMVLMNKNFKDLPNSVKFCNDNKVSEFLLQPLIILFQSMSHLKLNDNEIKELQPMLREAIRLTKKFGMHTNLHEYLNEDNIKKTSDVKELLEKDAQHYTKKLVLPCYDPWIKITVLPSGKIGPCVNLAFNNDLNILKDSLEDIWFNRFEEVRTKISQHSLPEHCNNCCIWKRFENQMIREKVSKTKWKKS